MYCILNSTPTIEVSKQPIKCQNWSSISVHASSIWTWISWSISTLSSMIIKMNFSFITSKSPKFSHLNLSSMSSSLQEFKCRLKKELKWKIGNYLILTFNLLDWSIKGTLIWIVVSILGSVIQLFTVFST